MGIRQNQRSYYIKWVITIILTSICVLIPSGDMYTPEIKKFFVVTVFALAIAAFEFFNIIVPSIILTTGYFISGSAPIEIAFGGWTSTVTWIVLGAFLMAYTFDEIGLLKRIAYWVILKSGGTFNRTVLGLMLASTLVTFVTFGNSYVIMAALAYGVCKAMKLGKSRDSAIVMMGALIGSATARGVIYAPTNLSLINAGAQTVVPDFNLTWIDQLLKCSPIFLLLFVLYFMLIKLRINKDDVNSKEYINKEYMALGKMSIKEKKGLFVLTLVIIYLVLGPIHHLPMDWGFMVIPWFLFIPGISVATSESIRKIDFSMVFFVVGCLSIGFVSNYLGIGDIVADAVTPLLEPLGPSIALYSIFLLGTALNFFMTPLAFLAGFSGPVAAIANNLGVNAEAYLFMLNFSADGIFLPYEYVPYLIAYSFGVIPMGDFVKINVYKFLIYTVFIFVCIIPFWKLIGLM